MQNKKINNWMVFFTLAGLTWFCQSPPPKKATPLPTPTKVTEEIKQPNEKIAFLESIEDGRELPDSKSWEESQYKSFTIDDFLNYEPAKRRINFTSVDYPLLNAAIFYISSKFRVQLGLSPLVYSETCEQAAFAHAQDMVNYNFYSHTSKVTGKTTLVDRLEIVGNRGSMTAENIIDSFALEYQQGKPVFTPSQNNSDFFSYTRGGTPIPMHTYLSLAESLVSLWFNSPGHRTNILNPELAYAGMGAYLYQDARFGGLPRVKAVQVFSSKP